MLRNLRDAALVPFSRQTGTMRRWVVAVCALGIAVLGGCSFGSDNPGAASMAQRVQDGDAPADFVVPDGDGVRRRQAEELDAMLLTSRAFDRHTTDLPPEARYLVDAPIVLCGGTRLEDLAGGAASAATGFGRYEELSVIGTGSAQGDPDGEWFTQRVWRFESTSDAAGFVDAAEAAFGCREWVADPGAPELVSRVVTAVPEARVGDDGFAVVKVRGPIVTTYQLMRLGPFVTLLTDSLVVAGDRVPAADELPGDRVQIGLVCAASRRIVDMGGPEVGHDVDLSACETTTTTASPEGATTASTTTSTAAPGGLSP